MNDTAITDDYWLHKWNSWESILATSLATMIFVIAIVYMCFRQQHASRQRQRLRQQSSGDHSAEREPVPQCHNWSDTDLFDKPAYCNVCESAMMQGIICHSCNLFVHSGACHKQAKRLLACKQLCQPAEDAQPPAKWSHHWVKGNLPLGSHHYASLFCLLCNDHDELCGQEPSLCDYKCVWCWRTVHEKCKSRHSDNSECHFGEFARLMLRPDCVALMPNYRRAPKSLLEVRMLEQPAANWTPLVIFANSKSGSADALSIVHALTMLLNPLQVVEMNKTKPDQVLKWMADCSSVPFKILVCGGDGSIGWILEGIAKQRFKHEPCVAILPLGTGNDLSRALNWGPGYVPGESELSEILGQIDFADAVKLDRWSVQLQRSSRSKQQRFMNNYLSVGCDALVTLNFHRDRQNMFFANRLLNKLLYFKYGTIDTFMKECFTLTENVEIELDGRRVEQLPHLESIVVMNIPFWGGGTEPWAIGGGGGEMRQSFNDGLLEVFGIYSSFHIAQMRVNLAEPYRIGQAKQVKIDGEPWEQDPVVIDISFYNQATMLRRKMVS